MNVLTHKHRKTPKENALHRYHSKSIIRTITKRFGSGGAKERHKTRRREERGDRRCKVSCGKERATSSAIQLNISAQDVSLRANEVGEQNTELSSLFKQTKRNTQRETQFFFGSSIQSLALEMYRCFVQHATTTAGRLCHHHHRVLFEFLLSGEGSGTDNGSASIVVYGWLRKR